MATDAAMIEWAKAMDVLSIIATESTRRNHDERGGFDQNARSPRILVRARATRTGGSNMDMKGKVALVTGAASGIGRASAIAFASRGAAVVVCDIADAGETVQLIQRTGGSAIDRRMDIMRAEEVEQAVRFAVEEFGRLDYAHNNAGYPGPEALLHDYSLDDFDRVMKINAYGTFLCMKYEIQQMLKQGGGAIVNTASTSGLRGLPSMPAYSASKHAVIGLTKVAAIDYGRSNIRVNAICPGTVRTPMITAWIDGDPAKEAEMSINPVGRMAEAGEQAEVAVWLCSDSASHVSGVALAVDGGLLAGATSEGYASIARS